MSDRTAAVALDLDHKREAVAAVCRRLGVQRLDLFGSATTASFDPARSDLDFLVEFDQNDRHLFRRYFDLKETLEGLFGRQVDLVSAGSLSNPYMVESVERTRLTIYAAKDAQAA